MKTWSKLEIKSFRGTHERNTTPILSVGKSSLSFSKKATNMLISAGLLGQYVDIYRDGENFLIQRGDSVLITKRKTSSGELWGAIPAKHAVQIFQAFGIKKYDVKMSGTNAIELTPRKD